MSCLKTDKISTISTVAVMIVSTKYTNQYFPIIPFTFPTVSTASLVY